MDCNAFPPSIDSCATNSSFSFPIVQSCTGRDSPICRRSSRTVLRIAISFSTSLTRRRPSRQRLDIFERVNGGVPLTRQQMRNCLYMGKATRFLREESKAELFLRATGRSLKTSAMRDREFVNRFCAFQTLPVDEYRNMDDFLAGSLKKMNAKPESLPMLSEQFKTTLINNLTLFGKHAFRKQVPGTGLSQRTQCVPLGCYVHRAVTLS